MRPRRIELVSVPAISNNFEHKRESQRTQNDPAQIFFVPLVVNALGFAASLRVDPR